MDTKERHIRENEGKPFETPDMIADSMKANGKTQKRENTKKINRLWLWLGVLILVFILLYWLFAMGTLGDLSGYFNGN